MLYQNLLQQLINYFTALQSSVILRWIKTLYCAPNKLKGTFSQCLTAIKNPALVLI